MAARVKTVCFQICTTIFVTEIQLLFFIKKVQEKLFLKFPLVSFRNFHSMVTLKLRLHWYIVDLLTCDSIPHTKFQKYKMQKIQK